MTARASFRRVLVVAGGAAVFSSVARADAPSGAGGQYGIFDQSNVIIVDNFTHLAWQRAARSDVVNFPNAVSYCQALSLGNLTTGWRLPSYKELLTLVDESPHAEYESGAVVYKTIDPNAFGFNLRRGAQTPTTVPYWSSSVLPPTNSGKAFAVDFTTGETSIWPTGIGILVRCVHDPH